MTKANKKPSLTVSAQPHFKTTQQTKIQDHTKFSIPRKQKTNSKLHQSHTQNGNHNYLDEKATEKKTIFHCYPQDLNRKGKKNEELKRRRGKCVPDETVERNSGKWKYVENGKRVAHEYGKVQNWRVVLNVDGERERERESGGEFCACSPCCRNVRGRERPNPESKEQHHRTFCCFFIYYLTIFVFKYWV